MNTEEIRKTYLPLTVRLLLVAESPPASGKFFYINSRMTTFTARAFQKAHGLQFKTTVKFLEHFKNCGCYLYDLTEIPVNKLEEKYREKYLIDGIEALAGRIRQMRPVIVVIALKKIKVYVNRAIEKSGVTAQTYVLPFPGNGHQNKYIDKLTGILMRHVPLEPNERA